MTLGTAFGRCIAILELANIKSLDRYFCSNIQFDCVHFRRLATVGAAKFRARAHRPAEYC